MTVSEIDPQIFGGLVENVKTLLIHQAEIKSELKAHQNDIRVQLHDSNKRLFEKIDVILDDVSDLKVSVAAMKPICVQHTDDIAKLKERPGRIIEIGAAAIAATCAVGMWLARHL